MIEVKPGQIWRDRDKRMSNGNRRCRVIRIEGSKAIMQSIHSTIAATKVSIITLRKRWELVRDTETYRLKAMPKGER